MFGMKVHKSGSTHSTVFCLARLRIAVFPRHMNVCSFSLLRLINCNRNKLRTKYHNSWAWVENVQTAHVELSTFRLQSQKNGKPIDSVKVVIFY